MLLGTAMSQPQDIGGRPQLCELRFVQQEPTRFSPEYKSRENTKFWQFRKRYYAVGPLLAHFIFQGG